MRAIDLAGQLTQIDAMGTDGRFPDRWLSTPLGRRTLATERSLVRRALEQAFGAYCIQIGAWGESRGFLRFARTQRRGLVDWRPGRDVDVSCDPDRLPIASDSVDVVLLPHTLEQVPSPHALLREVDRVLRPDGQLVILGFNSRGPWGLRHLLAGGGYPGGTRRMLAEPKLRDWLELLSFDAGVAKRYAYTLPFAKMGGPGIGRGSWFARATPFLAGGYMLKAEKQTIPITPVRQRWRPQRLRVVSSLVEPSGRVGSARRTKE